MYIYCERERERKCNDASESEPHMVRHVAQITRVATVLPLLVVVVVSNCYFQNCSSERNSTVYIRNFVV